MNAFVLRSRVNAARADRASSSLPWHVTDHARQRLSERFPEVSEAAFAAALARSRRLAEDTSDRKERWRVELGTRTAVAIAAIDAGSDAGSDPARPVRAVCTVVFPWRPHRTAIVPPDRPDL